MWDILSNVKYIMIRYSFFRQVLSSAMVIITLVIAANEPYSYLQSALPRKTTTLGNLSNIDGALDTR